MCQFGLSGRYWCVNSMCNISYAFSIPRNGCPSVKMATGWFLTVYSDLSNASKHYGILCRRYSNRSNAQHNLSRTGEKQTQILSKPYETRHLKQNNLWDLWPFAHFDTRFCETFWDKFNKIFTTSQLVNSHSVIVSVELIMRLTYYMLQVLHTYLYAFFPQYS